LFIAVERVAVPAPAEDPRWWEYMSGRRVAADIRESSTYHDVAHRQLLRLCGALELDPSRYLPLQEFLFAPWATRVLPARAPYPSGIGDDHSPYEYSITFDRSGAELRILFESTHEPALRSNRAASLALNRLLVERFGVSLDRFDAISDLFCPEDAQPPFTIWHAVALGRTGHHFKIYLNPRARGRAKARSLIEEALRRLGFERAASTLLDRIAWRGPALDEFNYFSLDLSRSDDARVKVYLAHHGASASDVERSFMVTPGHRDGDVAAHCSTLAGSVGPFSRKPVTSCFSFTSTSELPIASTFHFPVAHYTPDDDFVSRRVIELLEREGLPTKTYAAALEAFRPGSLRGIRGVHSYVSYRRDPRGLRFTVYLSPLLFTGTRRSRAASGVRRSKTR
jgi:DMATS type aromatic prenyltransferase